MPVIQLDRLEATVSPDQLLQAVRQLQDAELAAFCREVLRLKSEREAPRLSAEESALFERINRALLPEAERREYAALRQKLDDESLTATEHARLIELSDQREMVNADRIEALARLASLRGTSLRALMEQLGILGPGHA